MTLHGIWRVLTKPRVARAEKLVRQVGAAAIQLAVGMAGVVEIFAATRGADLGLALGLILAVSCMGVVQARAYRRRRDETQGVAWGIANAAVYWMLPLFVLPSAAVWLGNGVLGLGAAALGVGIASALPSIGFATGAAGRLRGHREAFAAPADRAFAEPVPGSRAFAPAEQGQPSPL